MKCNEVLVSYNDVIKLLKERKKDNPDYKLDPRQISWHFIAMLSKKEVERLNVFEEALDWGIGLMIIKMMQNSIKKQKYFKNVPLSKIIEVIE